MTEEWRPAPGHPKYEVSSLGRLRRKDSGRLRVLTPDSRGYLTARLWVVGRGRVNVWTHLLVATAFHGRRPRGLVADHVNRDKSNNAAVNLRWVAPVVNAIKGNDCGWAKLNSEVVKVMRYCYPRRSATFLSRLHGVCPEAARKAIVGLNWKEV